MPYGVCRVLCAVAPESSSSRSLRSASTMIRASSGVSTVACQPSFSLARDASPINASTSSGTQVALVELHVLLPLQVRGRK